MKKSLSIDINVNRAEFPEFLRNALSWSGSVTPKIIWSLCISTVYALIVSLVHEKYPHLDIDIGPFEYSGVVLGLLLVFRINSGYDRWWEGRKLWGSVVNQSRNLAIIGLSYSTAPREWRQKLAAWITLFPYAMKDNLRSEVTHDVIDRLVGDEEAGEAKNVEHLSLWVSAKLAELLSEASSKKWIDPFAFQRAERERAILIDDIGACERILKTPIPFVISVKLKRFLLLFLILLPFALVSKLGLTAPIVNFLIVYPLLSLDQIGFELQNPFSKERISHLPLDEICLKIESNISEILKITEKRN